MEELGNTINYSFGLGKTDFCARNESFPFSHNENNSTAERRAAETQRKPISIISIIGNNQILIFIFFAQLGNEIS